MAKKSCIVGMPILPYNQTKHSDVCQYLEYLENFLAEVFRPESEPEILGEEKKVEKAKQRERILEEIEMPLCGDLLGRERVTGAKNTRMGCDLRTERFDNIIENVAQWHTKQSFLAVRYEFVCMSLILVNLNIYSVQIRNYRLMYKKIFKKQRVETMHV